MIIGREMAMEGELNAFRRRQATRLVEIATTCEDADLRKRLQELAQDWLKGMPGTTTWRCQDETV
jgi:hypothetical protein